MLSGYERSADRLDRAAELEEEERQHCRLTSRQPTLMRTGFCHDKACGAPLSDTAGLFCDADCRNAWEREQAARRRTGR